MYTALYDAMIAWYRPFAGAQYVHGYAVVTLSVMALLNIGTITALSGHFGVSWASYALVRTTLTPLWVMLLSLTILAFHIWFSRWRRSGDATAEIRENPLRRWIAFCYSLLTAAGFLYASTLVPHHDI